MNKNHIYLIISLTFSVVGAQLSNPILKAIFLIIGAVLLIFGSYKINQGVGIGLLLLLCLYLLIFGLILFFTLSN